jgi:hypothetical protein
MASNKITSLANGLMLASKTPAGGVAMVGTPVHNGCMAKKKPQPPDRHKASGMVRLPKSLTDPLDRLVGVEGINRAELVRSAIREYLRARGMWPPK